MNTKKIIIKLKGGLGNQMFQYALGRKLSLEYNSDLKLDLSFLKKNKLRNYELDKLSVGVDLVKPSKFRIYNLLNTFHLLIPFYAYKKEKGKRVNKIEKPNNSVLFLEGYWQSEKYFQEIRSIIQKEFHIKEKINQANKEFLDKIQNSHSVAIHFRRRDYVTDEETRKHHGNCPLNYYKKGIKIINEKIKNPKYFIFSDDIQWLKDNFNIIKDPIFVDANNYKEGYKDLELMKNCKYFIIANSSFSWWGAWLSNNKNKIVIAPEKWFNSQDAGDILPTRWIKL